MNGQLQLDDSPEFIRLRSAWELVARRLSSQLPATSFDRFIRPLIPRELAGGRVRIVAPGKFVAEWVRQHFIGSMEELLSDELGEVVTIDLQAEPNRRAAAGPVAATVASTSPPATRSAPGFTPIAQYTFDRFVVGQSNRMAVAGARAVAAEPGKKYNPLFIYGQSGLGKTHLLHAIAGELLARDPKFNVVYITGQQFAHEFVEALQTGRTDQFRRAQRNVGVWLVDDIQFVAGKDKTSEEIFHTFNHLHSLGKQIVLCSDRPPRDLYLMDERLRSRFEAGLVADIQMPDTETRCAIVLGKAESEGIALHVEIAMYLAENVPGNVRVLEGALTKLAVKSSIDGLPITLELAGEMIEQYYDRGTLAKPSVEQIVGAVGKHYRIDLREISGSSRKAPIVHARHVAIYITREITGDSWKHIGSQFGDRDHTSMMHGYSKIADMMQADKDLRAAVKMLIRNLYPERA